MVHEAALGYICKMNLYTAEGQKLEDTVLLLLDRNLRQNHIYYSVSLAKICPDRKRRVYGTLRTKKGHST
jgi:hypothetical protein